MQSVPLPLAAALLLALAPGGAPAQRATYQSAQIMIREQVIVRVPRLAAGRPTKPVVWKEGKKGPKCIALAGLAGALINEQRSIDLAMLGGQRVRAQFGKRCPTLDFYSGFYLKPTADGMVCAERDVVRTRGGRACEIERFRTLVAER